MKFREFSLILVLFGAGIILHSLLNCYETLYPFLVKNPQWIFMVSQKMPGILILMFLGLITALLGLMFLKHKKKNIILKYSRLFSGGVVLMISFLLFVNMVLYGISMNAVKNTNIKTLKSETGTVKENLKYGIEELDPKEMIQVNNKIKELDNNLYSQINYLNMAYTKINIKTLGNLFLFSLIYLILGLKFLSWDKFLLAKYHKKYGKI